MSILICDIDGVICDSSLRLSKYSNVAALESGDYNAFRLSMNAYNSSSLEDDVVISHGIDLLNSLCSFYNPSRVVFLTFRGELSRVNTLDWLRYNIPFLEIGDDNLIMRPEYVEKSPGVFWLDGDIKSCPVYFKCSVVRDLLLADNIVMALDDYESIVTMYQSLGIPSLCVKWPGVDCILNSRISND